MGNTAFASSSTRNGATPARPPSAGPDVRSNSLYLEEGNPLKLAESWEVLRKTLPYVWPHRRLIAIKLALALASLSLFLLMPWPMKIIIDNVINQRPLTGLPRTLLFPLAGDDPTSILSWVCGVLVVVLLFAGMFGDQPRELRTEVRSGGLDQAGITSNQANDGWSLWNGIFGTFEVWITLALTQRINQSLRTAIYERFLRSPLHLYADQKIGDAVFRVMLDSAAVSDVLYQGIMSPLLAVIMYLLTMVVLTAQFPEEPAIPLLAALVLPLMVVVSAIFGRPFRDQSQRMRERGSEAMAAFEERLAHVHAIQAFGQEPRERANIDRASWNSYKATFRMLGILALGIVVAGAGVCLLMFYGFYHLMLEVVRGRITLGDVILIATYAVMLGGPMGNIGATWAKLQYPIAGLRRVHSVLDRLPDGGARDFTRRLNDPIRAVECRELSVGYDARAPILEQVSLILRRGELAAIAGPSGSGKTTLTYSLPRFLEPLAGKVFFDDVNARSYDLDSIRRRIAFVFQQEALFSTTIEENIRYGFPEASGEKVREAAELAGAAAFIERLPDGYQTMLGRRGTRLSVGQKQRIAIARALIRDPDVIVLDEPMAPLDYSSEAALMSVLRELAKTRIVLLVAHRPETLNACDAVYFVNGGTVAAHGTHRELIGSCRAYSEYLAVTASEIRG